MPTPSQEDDRLAHARVGSWFLGPRAENFGLLSAFLDYVLAEQKGARQKLYPDDPAFITAEMQASAPFQESVARLWGVVKEVSGRLATHSIPFWSPRYNGHMNMDTSLAGIVGYISAMLYNPNNVATEASPYTTFVEKEVGLQLCRMLGYSTVEGSDPCGWGHITCDGSVANLEAIWAARNLKFYPLSLRMAMRPGNPLEFLASVEPEFKVEECKGGQVPFASLSTWQLLNLTPATVLDIPTRLFHEYGISAEFLQWSLKPFLVQTLGREVLEAEFGVKPGRFYISTTKHYSWPKGGAITGIGSKNFVDVKVDLDARMDMADLRHRLDECVAENTPVYGVVAIMGSTEHGACDPLASVLAVREEYRQQGLSFAVHCDAAWGGYFASLVEREDRIGLPLVPALGLSEYTYGQLTALEAADSITIDPHKSGYINYPAGGLCYRDGRMRYLVTWTSPIVYHAAGAVESMGVYGVEGSKPGASPVATYVTHRALGLNPKGYGRLLGEALFTCTKLYCHWATMASSDLIVVPLNRLPAEKEGKGPAEVEKQKEFIRQRILAPTNEELMKDKAALELLNTLGGDLMINAFACNFHVNGKPNTDVSEANYLNTRIFKRLSVNTMTDKVADRPLFLTESTFGQDEYGACLREFKRRLQLGESAVGSLVSLVNVTMSPWPTDSPFQNMLAGEFKKIAEEEVKNSIKRNTVTDSVHGFVMQGSEHLFLVHLPMFHMANHRWQLVIAADIPEDAMKKYRELRQKHPDRFYTVANTTPGRLADLVSGSFAARMDEGIPSDDTKPIATFDVTNVRVVVKESLSSGALTAYPSRMPFYLYGSSKEVHIDHALLAAPNAMLSADQVSVDVKPALSDEQLHSGVVAILRNVRESAMQPLPLESGQIIRDVPGLSFVPGKKYAVDIFTNYGDSLHKPAKPLATGSITLGSGIYADWKELNMDPADEH